MPYRPRSICSYPGCGALTLGARCDQHRGQEKREHDARRPNAAARGYGAVWRRVRLQVLSGEPLCRTCKAKGRITSANEVDHIDGNSSNNDTVNLRALCKPCHSARTARDQAFGRKGRGGAISMGTHARPVR